MDFSLTLVVTLLAAVTAGGTQVVDQDGRPVTGARVEVAWVFGATPLDRLTPARLVGLTDLQGRVPVPFPRLAGSVVLVDHPDFAPLRWSPGDGSAPPQLVLSPSPWQGRLAAPPAGPGGWVCATAELAMPGGARSVERCAPIAEDGRLTLPALPGPVRLTVSAPGFVTQRLELPQLPDQPITLAPGVTVTGTLIDCAGEPVAGARLRWPGGEERTRADGTFLLGAPQLPVELTVEGEGLAATTFTVAAADAPGLALRVPCREGVEATLLGPESPYRGELTVALQRLDCPERCPEERRTATTDAGGRLVVPVGTPGRFRLTFAPLHFKPHTVGPVEIGPGQRLGLGTVVLDTGGGVEGRVVDGNTGEPLAGVAVELMPVGPAALLAVRQGRRPAALSGGDGEFRLGGVPPGRYLVSLSADGYAPFWQVVDVPEARLTPLGVVAFAAGTPLAGRLHDRSGRAVAGAEIRLRDAAGEYAVALETTQSGGEGEFAFPAVAPGVYRLEAWAGRRLLVAQEVEHPGGDTRLAGSGVTVRGVVRHDGLTVPHATVTASSLADGWEQRPILQVSTPEGRLHWGTGGWSAVTNAGPEGAFTLADVPPGVLLASWRTPEGSFTRTLPVPDAEEVELLLEASGHRVVGRVELPAGHGGPAHLVVYDPANRPLARGTAGPDGSFALPGVPAGPATLEVRLPQGGGFRVPIAVPTGEPLRLTPPTQPSPLPLEVRFTRAGEAVIGVQAVLFPEGSPQPMAARLATAEVLTFPVVPAGRYHLAWAEPLAGAGVTSLELAGSARSPVVIQLPVGGSVSLNCPTAACAGAAVAELGVESPDGVDVTPLLTGWGVGLRLSPSGRLSLGRLAPGRWRVSASAAQRSWTRELDVLAGRSAKLELP